MTTWTIQKDVPVAMRDGVRLATDVYLPDLPHPLPTLMVRVPYGKDDPRLLGGGAAPSLFAFLAAGYAVVMQDVRGTFNSDGDFAPMVHEAADGADTLRWIADQPWYDGTIGSYGASYLGFTQWAAARNPAPTLRAIAPSLSSVDHYAHTWRPGGALNLDMALSWSAAMGIVGVARGIRRGAAKPGDLAALAERVGDIETLLRQLPLAAHGLDGTAPWYQTWLEHPDYDEFWSAMNTSADFAGVTAPALSIGGWYDFMIDSTLRGYRGMRDEGGSAAARGGQRLIVGPWTHGAQTGAYLDRQFGPAANILGFDMSKEHVAFFDRWLRGIEEEDPPAPVRIFVMGADVWRDEQDWPLPDTRYDDYFLSSAGTANTADGDGVLGPIAPARAANDVYLYDPRRPVPSLGGQLGRPSERNEAGPVDQRPVEARADVLCYTTPVLEQPIEVTGHVELVLHVSSSAVDTDFTAKLVDVHPDGRAIILTEGIRRARYRNSFAAPELLEPGEVYELRIALTATSNVFLPGHRIRLEVSSSNFPRWDRNTNTGGALAADGVADVVVAQNRVHHGPAYPSRLVLPTIWRQS